MSSLYLDFIRIRFLTMLAYRVNYYSGILVYTLNIGVYYFTWQAIYGGKEQLAGFTAAQMTTYVAVSWMARAFYFNNLDREIATEIRDGTIAIQFIHDVYDSRDDHCDFAVSRTIADQPGIMDWLSCHAIL
jgi:ABC-2 type transport system permease protein